MPFLSARPRSLAIWAGANDVKAMAWAQTGVIGQPQHAHLSTNGRPVAELGMTRRVIMPARERTALALVLRPMFRRSVSVD